MTIKPTNRKLVPRRVLPHPELQPSEAWIAKCSRCQKGLFSPLFRKKEGNKYPKKWFQTRFKSTNISKNNLYRIQVATVIQ